MSAPGGDGPYTGPTGPVTPPDGTTAVNQSSPVWQPTVATPTQPDWANLPSHRPLGHDDPREVGGYRLRAVLGEGGMGRVYLSYTPGGRPVAIKVVRAEYSNDPSFRRRFEQEVTTAQRVQGVYTAPVIDAGPHAPQPWLATAYVPGPSLQYAVGAYGPLPAETVLILVAGIAEALHSIHSAGVVHRDLKPSNVILASDGPRVIDFGIARAVDSTSMTRTGFVPGTPAFMSPEHVRGETVTAAADVFALGVLANFAATGELAFGGGMDPAVPYRILEQEPNLDGCPDEVRAVVVECLKKDPQQRPDPMRVIELCRGASTGTRLVMGEGWLPPTVAAEVHRIAAAPVPPPPADPVPPQPPKRGRTGIVLAAAGVLLLVAAGVTAYVSGVFEAKTTAGQTPISQSNTVPSSGGRAGTVGNSSTDESGPATSGSTGSSQSSAGSSRTGSPSSVPRVSSGPGTQLGNPVTVNIAAGYGVSFDQPGRVVDSGSSTDLDYSEYSGLVNDGKAVILDAGQPATYETCTTDTRFVTDEHALSKLPAGATFCVLNDGYVALVQIKKVPDKQAASQFYELAITLWQGPSS